jgi:peptidase M28-like protein
VVRALASASLTLLLAACTSTHAVSRSPSPAAAPEEASVAPPPPPDAPALPATPPAPLDESIVRALGRVTTDSVEADVDAISIPRHYRTAPKGLTKVAGYIERELTRRGFTVERQRVRFDGSRADNVIAERRGTNPDRVVVVCAHYDAVEGSPGADDDGSGVATLLGVARALEGSPATATLRLVAFAFEEQGLVGSAAYVASLDDAERRRIAGVLDVEMVGYTDARPGSQHYPSLLVRFLPRSDLPATGDFVALVGLSDARAPFDALMEARRYVPDLKVVGVPLPRAVVTVVPDLLRSDHAPFWLAGIPAVMMGDTADYRTPHYHEPSDVPATIDLEFTARVARWTAAGSLLLARGDSQEPAN